MNTDFLCEIQLNELNPRYSRLVKDTAIVSNMLLEKYSTYFPQYTDHSISHSLQVIDFCNRLIGNQIKLMNEDEIYILIMACYLHDCGMGISEQDYHSLKDKVITREYLEKSPDAEEADAIRDFHHEFSSALIYRLADFFEIPSDRHVFAIAQVAKGHRRVDLRSTEEYPAEYEMPNGNVVCIPYLAALIRLADELDIAADRNILVDYEEYSDNLDWRKHFFIRHLEIEEERFVLSISTEADKDAQDKIEQSVEKLRMTLDECIEIVDERTPYEIRQKRIDVEYV